MGKGEGGYREVKQGRRGEEKEGGGDQRVRDSQSCGPKARVHRWADERIDVKEGRRDEVAGRNKRKDHLCLRLLNSARDTPNARPCHGETESAQAARARHC